MTNAASVAVAQESKNVALLLWVGTLFLGFIPGLIVYLTKKDDPYVQDQAKEALNWAITAIIGYFIGFILTFVLVGVLVLFCVGILHFITCILGIIGASNGKNFRSPLALRLVK